MKYDNFSLEYFGPMTDIERPFALRHDIYCTQNAFLPVKLCGLEMDTYDAHAVQAVISRAATLEAVAVVRVIPCGRAYTLPFDDFEPGIAKGQHWGEVSRIGISNTVGLKVEERREVLCHLFKAVYQLSLGIGVSHWVCMMPTALQVRMAMRGVTFNAIGEPVEYHGLRQPCVGVAHRILSSLETDDQSMYNFIINR